MKAATHDWIVKAECYKRSSISKIPPLQTLLSVLICVIRGQNPSYSYLRLNPFLHLPSMFTFFPTPFLMICQIRQIRGA